MQPHSKPPKHNLKKPPLPPIAEPTPAPEHHRLVLPSSLNNPPRTHYLRSIFFFLLTLIASLGLFSLWLAPKLPIFILKPVQLTQFGIKPGSDGTIRIRTGSSVFVEVRNPNSKLAVFYGVSEMEITANGDVELGSASLNEFAQPTRSVTLLRFAGSFSVLVDEETGRRLNHTVKTGEVEFTVEVKTEVGFGLGKFRTVKWPVDVACGGVSLNKVREDGPQRCRVNWFVW